MNSGGPLRIALLTYRGHPYTGGQGIYVRHLSRELTALGHSVEVLSGPPYPELDAAVTLTKLPSLDLYRMPDPFHIPKRAEFKSWIDMLEFVITATATFAEPLTFSLRALQNLRDRASEFDIVHDNQCLGYGILGIERAGLPVLETIHHPITVDRRLEVRHAPTLWTKFTKWRFYGFTAMQKRVARRLRRIVTVSENSMADVKRDYRIPGDRLHLVHVGVDSNQFRPLREIAPVAGRIMTTASADVAMKGLVYLLEAVAKIRIERDVSLVIIGQPRADSQATRVINELNLHDCIEFVSGVTDRRIVELYNEAEVAVVPSLYEGFSLPAVEAMAAGTPLIATTGGALPEVVGPDGETALHVPPGDSEALAARLREALDRPRLRDTIGAAGRNRVEQNYSWRITAERTVDQYRALLAEVGQC